MLLVRTPGGLSWSQARGSLQTHSADLCGAWLGAGQLSLATGTFNFH